PHPHRREAMAPEIAQENGMANPPAVLSALFRQVRHESARDWRCAIDSLRPAANSLWQALNLAERQRFLRHLKVYWDAYRHRMAPEIGDAIDRYRHEGRLQVHAGRLLSVFRGVRGLEVSIAQRRAGVCRMEVDRIVNCTGIDEKYAESSRPLIRSLIAKGLASANALGIGFSADAGGALIDREGQVSLRLFTLGPPRSGDLIETVAVPEIRAQADILARRLSAAAFMESPARAAPPSWSET
ncbi:MAG: FAD/NAD(P)-binding protein, partial [Bryobacteraceae bacterium]